MKKKVATKEDQDMVEIWVRGKVHKSVRLTSQYHSAPVDFLMEDGSVEWVWVRKSEMRRMLPKKEKR